MNVYLFHPEEYQKLYNCTFYDIDQIPLSERTHPVLGAMFIALFLLFESLYLPCVLVMAKHLKRSAYKFMFAIGITDVICLWINGFLTGYFAIIGAVGCSYPNFMYVAGAMGLGLWIMESVSAMLLAMNRCIETAYPWLGELLYEGNRGWIWLLVPVCYSSYVFMFTKPVFFSGIYLSWFFNPHMGYVNDFGTVYYNMHHTVHNIVVLSGLIALYFVFVIVIATKTSTYNGHTQDRSDWSKRMRFNRKSFVQVFIICFINASAAAIYVYMQFFPVSDVIIVLGQLFWHLAHGIPSVIYWSLNKTIRKDCLGMIRKVKGSISTTTSKIFPSLHGTYTIDGAVSGTGNSGNLENGGRSQPQEEIDPGF